MEGPGNDRPNPGPGAQVSFPASFSGRVPEQCPTTNYTIPGILHFIKHEWSRFEKERTTWEVQKAELHVRKAISITIILSCVCINQCCTAIL